MTDKHHQLSIVAGPSREELFDALRLRHEGRRVSFTVEVASKERKTFDVQVDGINVESDCGNKWILNLSDGSDSLHLSPRVGFSVSFEGYFDTTYSEGWMRPTT